MENTLPLHACQVHNLLTLFNRAHLLLHSIALAGLIYYRASYLFQDPKTRTSPILPWLLVFISELLLSFDWLLSQAFRWRPISRTVFPDRLPGDDKLPAIDVFICTADPNKEPTVEVMNTVLSAMALDYPPEKLNVYLSDDSGSDITLQGMKEAWKFGRWWVPFCRKYGIQTVSPEAYFYTGNDKNMSSDLKAEKEKVLKKYTMFKQCVSTAKENQKVSNTSNRDHPTVVEVISESSDEGAQEDERVKMPLLIYVAREKRPSHPHHFKAGALNILLRVSGLISNSPYILVLDCDMYCNDAASARLAMCFHCDPQISPSLAFVQFPQKFQNISKNDIYDSQIRHVFTTLWYGADGLNGPIMSGTNFYVKRESLYGKTMSKVADIAKLRFSFGSSNEFIKSVCRDYKPRISNSEELPSPVLQEEAKVLCSCTYENHTTWGEEVGFMYGSVVEDYLTGFILHCRGWRSVYLNPSRPQFLGTPITNLNDHLIQGTRWYSGLVDVALSRFCPFIYGVSRMSFLQSMFYAELAFLPLFHGLPALCLATIPQLCLLNGIPIYPQVSSSFFVIFLLNFLSVLFQHLSEVVVSRNSIKTWINEQRIFMIRSVTAHLYGSLDSVMKKIGIRDPSFLPTNKVADDEQFKRYQMGIFDFQTSNMFLVPLVTLVTLNIMSLFGGVIRSIVFKGTNQMFLQVILSLYILVLNYPVIEGMVVRKDTGRVPFSVTLLSATFSIISWFLGSFFLIY